MKIKIIAVFIVLILLAFSIGVAVGITRREVKPLKVEADSSVFYGKAPLSVTFTSTVFNLDGKIKKASWNFNDGTTSNQRNTSHTFDRNGTFNVTVTIWDEQGHKTSDSIEIIVYNYYHPIAKAISDKNYGKAPLTIQFKAEAFDIEDEKITYEWEFDDGLTSNIQNPEHTFQEAGTYAVRLTATDSDGLKDTDVVYITANNNYPPIAKASADIESGNAPLTVQFYGHGEDVDGSDLIYHWHFENTLLGKNDDSSEQNPTHTFYSPGIYLVKLTVEDKNGKNDTDIVKITVDKSPFSTTMDLILKISQRRFISGFIADFIGSFFGKITGNIFGSLINNRINKSL